MKKIISVILVIALLALVGCGSPSNSNQVPEEDYVNRYPGKYNTALSDYSSIQIDEAQIKADFERAVDACADVINGFVIDISQSTYPMPTLDEYSKMGQAIGALGFPVDYYDFDMPNYEKVVAFWDDVQAGKDAHVVIYRLFNWGIVAEILANQNGEQFCTSAVFDFPQGKPDGQAEVRFGEPIYKIDDLRMTEKGYLIYLIHNDDPDAWPENRGYRVLPLGDELRELGRKYVWGIGYLANKMLTENWDKDNLSDLNMDWVFDSLYYKANGHMPYEDYPDSGTGDSRVLIPTDVMEKVMLNALPITPEQLRGFIPYDGNTRTYAYQTFNGGGYSPMPEVIKAEKSADGTLALTIDAVALEFGRDTSMRSILTVSDNPDGSAKYLSNKVIIPYE